ncbi:MAG: cobamide remodeling phosphodiesterase CbiR [Kiritimatiellaeota bacterium]|nr:cobamide remodeling phosphodiesterase CbiR [Kiritimatiellota bacterium]
MSPFRPIPPLPTKRAFRLGVTSYVFPADILPNAEALAGGVDDIELVLFESKAASNLPTPAVMERLAELGRRHRLTYTVHFPLDCHVGSPDAEERAAAVRQIGALRRLTLPIEPYGYVLHLEGINPGDSAGRVQQWQRDTAAALQQIFDEGPNPRLFCVENLAYPFTWCEPLLERFGLSVCLDVGHLWRGGADVDAFLERHLPRTRIIHLHGVRDGQDHLPLTALDPQRLRAFLRAIREFSGVVTLEVFEYDALRLSIERLTACLENEAAG